MTTAPSGTETDVWALTDHSLTADSVWYYGQAEVYSHQVAFHVLNGDTGSSEGWAAIDEVLASEEYEGTCPTMPETSAVTTVAPDTPPTTAGRPGQSSLSLS